MNIKRKCEQIHSLLGDLSSTGIEPIPDIVLRMRQDLSRIEEAAQRQRAADNEREWKEAINRVFNREPIDFDRRKRK